jgi:MFS family permease
MKPTHVEPRARPGARPRALATLRHRDYRLLWMGVLCSGAGLQIQMVAVGWHMYVLTDSPLQLGLVGLARAIPFMLVSFVGGAVADVVDRRRILVSTQGLLALITAYLALSTARESVQPWLLYVVTLVSAAAFSFDSPTREAMVPGLVPREELANALTLTTLARKTANIAAPGLAGLVIGAFGLTATYVLNVGAFLLVIVAVLLIRTPSSAARQAGRRWELVVGGLTYARKEPLILTALGLDFLVSVLANPWALLPVFARDVLLVGPQGLGVLHASASAGAVVGSIVLSWLGGARRLVPVMLAASAGQGLFVIAFGLSPVFLLSALLLFAAGVSNVVAEVMRATMVQLRTPDELRGRVMALSQVFTGGGPQLGYLQAGTLASAAGPVGAEVIGGAAALLAVLMFSQLPPMRRTVFQASSA